MLYGDNGFLIVKGSLVTRNQKTDLEHLQKAERQATQNPYAHRNAQSPMSSHTNSSLMLTSSHYCCSLYSALD